MRLSYKNALFMFYFKMNKAFEAISINCTIGNRALYSISIIV